MKQSRTPPFANVFRVDSDLSVVAFQHAYECWKMVSSEQPTILWISSWPSDIEHSKAVLEWLKQHSVLDIQLAVDSGYEHSEWSLGTLTKKGVGSSGI